MDFSIPDLDTSPGGKALTTTRQSSEVSKVSLLENGERKRKREKDREIEALHTWPTSLLLTLEQEEANNPPFCSPALLSGGCGFDRKQEGTVIPPQMEVPVHVNIQAHMPPSTHVHECAYICEGSALDVYMEVMKERMHF